MFDNDDCDLTDMAALRSAFDAHLSATLDDAMLTLPQSDFFHQGGKTGVRHTEHLGHMLATMQSLPRSYPDAKW
jgi:ring-1,2-phenylacetyl-CoA epoxidase subunit PaaC